FNWQSFGHTNPNQNIYYRDDFRDNNLEAWTIVGGTWAGVSQYMRGTGTISWQTNRVRVGSTSWGGQDILLKVYVATINETPNFFLRADSQDHNVNSYGFQLEDDMSNYFRVAGGAVLEVVDLGAPFLPTGAWYWLRFQIYTTGGNVVTRVKWWVVGNDEPGAWTHSHTFAGEWRSSGCFSVGRHTTGTEISYDDILISRQEGIPSPANCSVSFKFWASNDGTNWGSEYTDITLVPNSRFIKIEA
ncbi:unnamed protein product, partial [marine sediment metagenome]